jgi:hypothetical protein
LFAQPTRSAAPYDILIQHDRIIDGTGNPWYVGDLEIRADRFGGCLLALILPLTLTLTQP